MHNFLVDDGADIRILVGMRNLDRPREAPEYVCAFQNNRKYAIKSV